MVDPSPSVQWVSSTPVDIAVTASLVLVLLIIIGVLVYAHFHQKRKKTYRAATLPIYVMPASGSQVKKFKNFPTKGILLPPSTYQTSARERSIRFQTVSSPSPPPPRTVSFGGRPLESIPEEDSPIASPVEAYLGNDTSRRLSSTMSDWTYPTASRRCSYAFSVQQEHLKNMQFGVVRDDSFQCSERGRLARLQSLLEIPCNAVMTYNSTLSASASMPSIFSLPSWLAERSQFNGNLATARVPSKRELSIIGPPHLRCQSADGQLMSDSSKPSFAATNTTSSLNIVSNFENRDRNAAKAHESVGTLMLSRFSLASTISSSNSDSSSESTARCACSYSPPTPFEKNLRPISGITISEGEIDESEIVIATDNWSKIRRVPSLIRNRKSITVEKMVEIETDQGAGKNKESLEMTTGEHPPDEASTGDLLEAKATVTSLSTSVSLYGGISCSQSLARSETAIIIAITA